MVIVVALHTALVLVVALAYIISDILSLKTTRAFWRQNTFTFNKPAPLGAKILGVFHLEVLHPFLFLIRFSGSDQPILCVYKLMSLIK
jgi:hypothetical protein